METPDLCWLSRRNPQDKDQQIGIGRHLETEINKGMASNQSQNAQGSCRPRLTPDFCALNLVQSPPR
jgi:hypothetical protein